MRRLPKMAAALLAAVLTVSAALPALAADQRAELEAERKHLHDERVSAARYGFFTKVLGEKTYSKLKALLLRR